MESEQRRIGEWASVVLGIAGLLLLGAPGHRPSVAEATHIACGDLVDGNQTLDSDVGPCPGPAPAVTVGHFSILDLNGFTVSCGSPTALSVGVDLGGKISSLKNGKVTGCFTNVRASGKSHSVTGVEASLGVIGFFVPDGSNDKRFMDTTADSNSVGYLIDGDHNRLGRFAPFEKPSDINTATSNGVGFIVRGRHNHLENTIAVGNTVEGYIIFGSQNHVINTEASRNPNGYSFLGNLNRADLNTATGNAMAGIGNRGGLNHFTRNTAIGNGLDLFEATEGCGSNNWTRNSFGSSQDGEPPGTFNNPSICIR